MTAIIFDLNGVFIQSPLLSDRFEKDFGVKGEDFLPALKTIMAEVRKPRAYPMFSYWKPYFEKWQVKMSEKEFEDYWFKAEKEIPAMIELAKALKQDGYKLFILSNNFAERARYYQHNFSFLSDIFEKVYYSWQTGFVKPDENAYIHILKENNLAPEDCVYFDDSQKNIEVANSLGIKSFAFKDAEDTKNIISSL